MKYLRWPGKLVPGSQWMDASSRMLHANRPHPFPFYHTASVLCGLSTYATRACELFVFLWARPTS
ncbi:MAG TPA: hypothetical protein VN729_03115, partial [Ktedonobacteraceae bacterium]|nr:hypothetical protein [Ktedonobacteraceae bacterium]